MLVPEVPVDWQSNSAAAHRRIVLAAGPRTDRAGSRCCRSAVVLMIYPAGYSVAEIARVYKTTR